MKKGGADEVIVVGAKHVQFMKLGWFCANRSRDYNKVPASVWIRCYQLIPI